MLFFRMFFSPSLSMYFDVLLLFCLFLWHVPTFLYHTSASLHLHFFVSFFLKNTKFFCHLIFPLASKSSMCSIFLCFNPTLPTWAHLHPIAPSSLSFHFHLFVLLFHTAPVYTGGNGQSGARTVQTEGKSSLSLGGTSGRQGLCPSCIPAVSTVPSPQQFDQGNTALTL